MEALCIPIVEYKKDFDSIVTWAVLNFLQRCHSNHIQDQRTGPIFLSSQHTTGGCMISPKMYTNTLDVAFKTLYGRGIHVNVKYISHLRFTGDIVIFAERLKELDPMLSGLNKSSR